MAEGPDLGQGAGGAELFSDSAHEERVEGDLVDLRALDGAFVNGAGQAEADLAAGDALDRILRTPIAPTVP